ncbi:MAG: class I SAM-dependent methyltransferase [Gammaproteobacteria bacterium]|nr:class I SAM-dependent methyltransferase [Gammaproteobacteria bacterium]
MTSTIIPVADGAAAPRSAGLSHRLARFLVLRQLARISDGLLMVEEGERQWTFGNPSRHLPRPVKVTIVNASAWSDFAFGGSSEAGAAYIKGKWRCAELTDLIRLFLRNHKALQGFDAAANRLWQPLHKLGYWLQRNTRAGSRRNIEAHYDIGNDLFELFLDRNLMYSSAYYQTVDTDLETAAVAKLDLVCRKLELRPEHHLLEIGTGWGGLAIHAAKHYGCRVTTTTISREQYDLACRRVTQEGLSERVHVLCEDYRDLTGQYDRIVSIEMIEAVGHQFMADYFRQCSRLLKDDGSMLIQAITIADQSYEQALREVDFIKRFVFPGGFLPSITAMSTALTQATDLRISHLEDIGLHYARTLRDWRKRFMFRLDQVRSLGYPEEFIRLWDYYLCYSEGGFAERHLGTVQLLIAKPDARPANGCYSTGSLRLE